MMICIAKSTRRLNGHVCNLKMRTKFQSKYGMGKILLLRERRIHDDLNRFFHNTFLQLLPATIHCDPIVYILLNSFESFVASSVILLLLVLTSNGPSFMHSCYSVCVCVCIAYLQKSFTLHNLPHD